MLNKLRNELKKLPEDIGIDEFEDISVENFASALLKGYGWFEGRGIGKNAKEDVKVVEYTKKTGKEGLGFVNDMPIPPTKKEAVSNGGNKDKVHTSSDLKDEQIYDNKKSNNKRGRSERYETGVTPSKSWLNSDIRVRIISKELKGGRLFMQKGEIVDVVGPTTCDIFMDNSSELIQGVEQAFLETALPKCGGPVLVLYGRHKGVYGNLQDTDMDNETAVVRDADTRALLNVKLQQIAEYVGDLDDIGY